jgi:hypothetical protein
MGDLGPKDISEMSPVIFSHNSLLQVYLQEIDPVYMQTDLKALKGHTTIAYQYGAKQIPWETARSHPLNSYHVLNRGTPPQVPSGSRSPGRSPSRPSRTTRSNSFVRIRVHRARKRTSVFLLD